MSLLPYILGELNDLSAAADDGRGLRHEHSFADLLGDLMDYRPASRPSPLHRLERQPSALGDLYHPVVLLRRQLSTPRQQRGQSKDKDAFAVDVNVKNFRPEELSVQVLKDEGYVVVEGSHEERPDEHGYVRRQFTRRFKLPAGVDPDTVTSRLSSDGILEVSAPRKEALPAPQDKARNVPITQTHQPAALHQHVALNKQQVACGDGVKGEEKEKVEGEGEKMEQ